MLEYALVFNHLLKNNINAYTFEYEKTVNNPKMKILMEYMRLRISDNRDKMGLYPLLFGK